MMRDIFKAGIGVGIAFLTYTILGKISLPPFQLINVFALVVLYFAVSKGEIFGAWLGTLCGLLQDSFSLGVFGISGLALTITGFLAGTVSKKINLTAFQRLFLFLFIMAGFELALWSGLTLLVFSKNINTEAGLFFIQPLITALLGSVVFFILGKIKVAKF